MQTPNVTHVPAAQLRPGDVVVLSAGDTRRIARVELLDSDLVHLDFGDGRLSLLDSWRSVVRLTQPDPTPDPIPDPDPSPDPGGPQ
jgi:hypothetical protein